MKTADFQYDLPEDLIAQRPPSRRSDSRLLVLSADGTISDHGFTEITGFLQAGDLLVLNDTRVIPARLLGNKASGGRIEVLVERVLNKQEALVHIRASKACKPGNRLLLEQQLELKVLGREGELYRVELVDEEDFFQALERVGRIPLPPYIDRVADKDDRDRYQTVYAESPGAVAAPTAGLHFDQALLDKIAHRGIDIGRLTLHVGAGTFQPVRSDNIDEHTMHSERIVISDTLASQIRHARRNHGRVIAVGTTVVRALESVATTTGGVKPYSGDTDIFIRPGYKFQVVDAMITNFHLPGSTLLMLVAAFAGKENIFRAYRHAVKNRYRFFSYGDAMFIERAIENPDEV